MNRLAPLLILPALAACTGEPVTLRNPFTGQAVTLDPSGYAQRRAQVELVVKSRFDEVLRDMAAGGGPALDAAFDAAAVPLSERAARQVQLQGDVAVYGSNPDALISQLLLFGA